MAGSATPASTDPYLGQSVINTGVGPTFAAEAAAAGVLGLPFSFNAAPGQIIRGANLSDADWARVVAVVRAHDPNKQAPADVPDNPTLGDWRVALTLWGRMDDVSAKVAALVASSDASKQRLGKIASERLNYSNNVLRSQLLQLKDAFGFTAADVDESLWRAQRVSLGDLSGTWPLAPAN